MYQITMLTNGEWLVECMIQDGWERWHEKTKQEAIYSLIQAAKTLNGSYIREDDITMMAIPDSPVPVINPKDVQLLEDIRRGAKKVLDFDHYFFKYRITEHEAKMIVAIREGRLKTF